ncbi:MAG: acyl-CoA dehydrogenase family protein [Syntrophobacteraceae bacterium]|nr:acyl-CoA dehydrogenase family protein [Syntrophobacteraceae bacterium]
MRGDSHVHAGLCESLACSIVPFLLTSAFGGPEIRRYVREYCDDTTGKMVGCFAFTEPDHGSDWVLAGQSEMDDPKFSPSVRAVRKGSEYVITGQKSDFISNGPIATHALLILNVDRSKGMRGTGIAFIPLDLPGISRSKPLDKLGLRSYPQGAIVFDEVKIPENMMIVSEPEQGFGTQQWILTPAGELLSSVNTGLYGLRIFLGHVRIPLAVNHEEFEHWRLDLRNFLGRRLV